MGRKSQLYLFPHHINGRAVLEQLSPGAERRDGWIPPNEFTILVVYDGLRQRQG
jgi:hypothetical protein